MHPWWKQNRKTHILTNLRGKGKGFYPLKRYPDPKQRPSQLHCELLTGRNWASHLSPPRHTGAAQKWLLKTTMSCSSNPYVSPRAREINGFAQDHKTKGTHSCLLTSAASLHVPASHPPRSLFKRPAVSASCLYPLLRMQYLGIPEMEETVEEGRLERVKDGVKVGPGPCSWYPYTTIPGEHPRKGKTERAAAPGQPSVPFVNDDMEEGDRHIDLISLECST